MGKNITVEIETLEKMLDIYCRASHGRGGLCDSCRELLLYAASRLANCPRHPKPACKNCPARCFSPEKSELLRAVMRRSGPSMIFRHPLLTLKHYL